MNKQRKTSNILNVFQYDETTGAVTLPSTLVLTAPASSDDSTKVPTTAWTRTYISSLGYVTGNQSISITGDASGSGTTSINLTLGNSGVTAGTYTKVTVDSKGRVTVGANATTSDISEGTNLYYTDARVLAYLGANNYATQSYVSTQINNLVSGAPGLLDTLDELAQALGDDPNFATTTATSLGNRLRIDIGTQGLSSTQQGYGRTNLGLGSAALSSTGDFATAAQGTKADTAFGWGNHASAGYLTSYTETSTLANVTSRGASTSTAVTFSGGVNISNLLINGAPSVAESSLAIGAMGTTEGGQLTLNKATSYTFAAHLDVWQDVFRILYGTNTATSGVALSVNLSTRQLILPQYTTSSTFTGTAAGVLAFDSSGNILTIAVPGGSVSSINAGTGVSVNQNTGAVTVSIGQSVAISASPSFDQVIATNNGNGTNFKIGDDAWIGDINAANTFRVQGQQDATQGYIVFGNSNATALGRTGTGALTYGGNTIYHAGNLTNLNQLTNGPGYITGSGSQNSLPIWNNAGGTSLGNSRISQPDADNITLNHGGTYNLGGRFRKGGTFLSEFIIGRTDSFAGSNVSLIYDIEGAEIFEIRRNYANSTFKVTVGSTPHLIINGTGQHIIGNTTAYGGLTISDFTANDGNDSLSFFYRGTSGSHESLIKFYDFRGQLNAAIGNNLHDDTSGNPRGRLVFETNNGTGIVERARINAPGFAKFSNTGTYLNIEGLYHEFRNNQQSTAGLLVHSTNASFDNNVLAVGTTRTASSAYNLINAYSQDFAASQFYVRGDGYTYHNSGGYFNGQVEIVSGAPLAFTHNSNTATYKRTEIYTNQNNTSGSNANGIFIERGRLTDSAAGEIRYFTIGARGGQVQWTLSGAGGTYQTDTCEVKPSSDGNIFIGRYSGGSATVFRVYQASADGYLELSTGANQVVTKLSGYTGTPNYTLANFGIGLSSGIDIRCVIDGGITTGSALRVQKQASQGDGSVAHFINNSNGGYSSYIYIGSNPGTDWKIGKNILNPTLTNYHFEIVDSSNNLAMRINNSNQLITIPGGIYTTKVSSMIGNANTEAFALKVAKGSYADSGGHTTFIGLGVEGTAWSRSAIGHTRTSSYDRGYFGIYVSANNSDGTDLSGSDIRVKVEYTGTVTASGDIVAYGSPSDVRLKIIKEKVQNSLDKIMSLNGYRFDWKKTDEMTNIKEDIGVIAQEVQNVLPELARTNEDGFMSVRYQGLTAVLIEAIKEQQTQIEELKNKLDLLIQNK